MRRRSALLAALAALAMVAPSGIAAASEVQAAADPPQVTLTATPASTPIAFDPAGPAPAAVPAPVRLTGTATSPSGAPIVETFLGAAGPSPSASDDLTALEVGPTASLVLARPGTYDVTLTATDELGGTTTLRQVRVAVAAPTTVCPNPAAAPVAFTDVPAASPHRDAISCAGFGEIVRGLDAATYGPERSLTRGQMASILARLLVGSGEQLFFELDEFDDDTGSVHERSIRRLSAASLLQGTGPRQFSPELPVTRGQMASFLIRAHSFLFREPLPVVPDAFDDDEGSVHEESIDQAAALGLASGTGPRTFSPNAPVRRDQLASFAVRFLEVVYARS